jgi:uncharacterized membrane protein YedE/YeeE
VKPLALPTWLVGLVSGVVFAIGLSLSGMTDPGKVLAFLDVAGDWDPTLAFVMGGAVGFHFLWLRFVVQKSDATPASSKAEGAARIDAKLMTGAAIFGAGWGMSGYCPGPALVSLGFGRQEAFYFVMAMLVGMAVHRAFVRRGALIAPWQARLRAR